MLLGPDFGYYPNASKSWLVVKEEKYDEACSMFQDTNIRITTDGQLYLGGCLNLPLSPNATQRQRFQIGKNNLFTYAT